jgi:hypothetical protein
MENKNILLALLYTGKKFYSAVSRCRQYSWSTHYHDPHQHRNLYFSLQPPYIHGVHRDNFTLFYYTKNFLWISAIQLTLVQSSSKAWFVTLCVYTIMDEHQCIVYCTTRAPQPGWTKQVTSVVMCLLQICGMLTPIAVSYRCMSGQYRRCQQCPLWCQDQFFFSHMQGVSFMTGLSTTAFMWRQGRCRLTML